MKRFAYAGAFALAAIALVAVLATGAIPIDAGSGIVLAMAAAPAIVTPEDIGNITKQLGTIETQMKAAADDVKKHGEALQAEVKNLGTATAETTKKVDDALLKHGDLAKQHGEFAGRLTEIEQTLAQRREQNEEQAGKSLGELFTDAKQFKEFPGKGNIRVPLSRKDILNVVGTVGSTVSPTNSLVGVTRVPGIVTPPERKLTVRDLIAPGETNQGSVEYVVETGFTNLAAAVTEGIAKPQSELVFDLRHAPVRTIATIFKASRQILDDAPALRSYINARGSYGVRLEEEDELLNGDGTGAHVYGIVPQATAYNAAFVVATDKQRIDTIRLAILQVFLAEFPASGIVLHPTDWARIQLLKDGENRYIIGNPQDGNAARLWNLPVVETQSMDETEFLVGAFNMGAQIFDRMEMEVLLSTEDGDNFVKNMVTIRVEERLALAVYRPAAFISGDFDTAT